MGFEDDKKKFFVRYRVPIIVASLVVILVLAAASGYLYGKIDICKKSGGIMAKVPGVGEQCIKNFVEAKDCKSAFSNEELNIVAQFCRDSTGLYPLVLG